MSSSEETAVAAANLAFYRALEARDLRKMDLVWWPDARATCIHPGWHRLDGWEEIRRSWGAIFENARSWTVACADVRIRLAGDHAWVICVEVITPFAAEPEEPPARMQATNVFLRRDGVWRMIHHHASPSPTQEGEEEEEEMVH